MTLQYNITNNVNNNAMYYFVVNNLTDFDCTMSVSIEAMYALDQVLAASAVIDNDSMSFPCRMWHIFAREILLNRDVFKSFSAEINLGRIVIRPWYDEDDIHSLSMREAFEWRIWYSEDQDRMNAHFDFWFDQIFYNDRLMFRYSNDSGIGVYARMYGHLYSFTNNLFGFVEFISKETYDVLHLDYSHWSLLSYVDENCVRTYCILYGTVILLNHHNQSGVKFEVFLDVDEAKDKAFRLSYICCEKTIDHGNAVSIVSTPSLQVERVRVDDSEANGYIFGRISLKQQELTRWGPGSPFCLE